MEKREVPFFVRFLEGQETLQVRTDVKAGGPGGPAGGWGGGVPIVTHKYPSDDDEGGEVS
jgi:hypothetical protein